ncbi:MAG: S8 family serine peptidase [Chloroflexaceae bacterium]|nr:S8 family serine peptidase [Chloroflexaceae bacterium]
MAASRRRADKGKGASNGDGMSDGPVPIGRGATTGKYLVLLRQDDLENGVQALGSALGVKVARSAEFERHAVDADALESADALVFDNLAVAVVNAPPEQFQALGASIAGDGPILAVEAERVVYALAANGHSAVLEPPTLLPIAAPPLEAPAHGASLTSYLLGYQDGVNELIERLMEQEGLKAETLAAAAALDESQLTWGLQATNVARSSFTGRGVRVAVLDTGMDLGHPDFVGRSITSRSFITGEAVQDGHGHGTHCIGTACGPRQPGQLPRYGVASGADIYVGKVLSNRGSGGDSGILAGINWAISNGCAVVSMSLGAPTEVGQAFSRIFETVARRALAAGTLIIAAAGNESRRQQGIIAPVGHPANCPSIMAVGAVDANGQIANFSCGGLNNQGGQVDIAGPGVAVRSSWPRPTLYRSISGTSMATPHVAGIAALFAEANPDMRGGALGWLLLQASRRLEMPNRDVGVGLVQAPV